MIGRPQLTEAAPYYLTYIDRIPSENIIDALELQLGELASMLREIPEEKSLHRYAPEKWSIRQVQSHINDCERTFLFRAFWFARGFDTALPSFDQNIATVTADADRLPLEWHTEEFYAIRAATLAFFRHLPEDAWMRAGIASGNRVTVRALSYITAGHADHHASILRARYL
jgi:hypothetical protein